MKSPWLKTAVGVVAWVIFISVAHYFLNCRDEHIDCVKIGYMPVISNLSVPIMAEAAAQNGKVSINAIRFSSFADMADALRNEQLDIAFIIAPLAIALRQQGVGIKLCYVGNRHESTLVARAGIQTFADLAGGTVAVPLRFSGHYILLRELAHRFGIGDSLHLVEMNPPDMASALVAGGLDAYFVGEPFAAQGLAAGNAKTLFRVEEFWPGFICNVMVISTNYLEKNSKDARLLIEAAARAGLWARDHLEEAASIASKWWGQPKKIVLNALTKPKGRVVFDRFVPSKSEFKELAQRMVKQGLISDADISGLIDPAFCPKTKAITIKTLQEVFPGQS